MRMLAPLRMSSWRSLWLLAPVALLAGCQSPTRHTPAAQPEPLGPRSSPTGVDVTAPGGERRDRSPLPATAVPRGRDEPFDRRLLPPPSIGGFTPMEGEALLNPQGPGAQQREAAQSPEDEHWSGLPMMSDLAREHGITLPEPLGLSLNYSLINRPSKVDKVRAGVNGGDLTELPSLAFEAEAQVEILIGRLDAWILPMLNVYVLGGYVWNESTVDVTVDLPGAPNTTFTANGNLEGPTYGVGTTLVGGYGRYFLLGDFNWNKVELGGLSEMDARLLTGRVGWRTRDLDWAHELRIYFATTYWDTARTIAGSLSVGGGPISSIEYAVDQSPVDPWTLGAGAHLAIDEHNGIVIEAQGYADTFYIVGGFTFRF